MIRHCIAYNTNIHTSIGVIFLQIYGSLAETFVSGTHFYILIFFLTFRLSISLLMVIWFDLYMFGLSVVHVWAGGCAVLWGGGPALPVPGVCCHRLVEGCWHHCQCLFLHQR